MSDTYQDVVIGAGVAGIVAALLQAKKGRKVYSLSSQTVQVGY